MAHKINMSLDAIIAKEGIPVYPKKNHKVSTDGSLTNVVFKVDNNGKRKADESLVETDNTSGKGSHFPANCGQIFVENLNFEVNDEDLQQLFSAFGSLKRAAINYEKNGRSAGTAFVVFNNKSDAKTAVESLQNVTLDGRALQLTVIDSGFSSMFRNGNNMTARVKRQTTQLSGGSRQMWSDLAKKYDDAPTESLSRGQQNKWNKNDKEKESINADDLDADLESYLAQRTTKS